MADIADMDETASNNESDRHTHRGRWKDAITRTKTKFKRDRAAATFAAPQRDFQLSDDVNDFLAAGRKHEPVVTARRISQEKDDHSPRSSPRHSPFDNTTDQQPSPRAPQVPRLDVSESSRWPNARPITKDDPRSYSHEHLAPDYKNERRSYERSQSYNSALAKKGSKPRGLSVTFVNAPPTIIGVGGDEALTPTCEISHRRQRSRSLSPYADRPSSNQSNDSANRSPIRRKPIISPPPPTLSPNPPINTGTTATSRNPDREDSVFQPRPMRRVQTGFGEQEVETPYTTKSLEQQMQDTLRLSDNLDEINNPFRDPRVEDDQKTMQMAQPVVAKWLDTLKPTAANIQPTTNQPMQKPPMQPAVKNLQLHQPQHQHYHPDLQQSIETAHKPPPPRMPNFYAELHRQEQEHSPEADEPSKQRVHHAMEKVTHSSHPEFSALQNKPPPAHGKTVGNRGQNLQEQAPPGGWI